MYKSQALGIVLILIVVLILLFVFVYPRYTSISKPSKPSNAYAFLISNNYNNNISMIDPSNGAVVKNFSAHTGALPVATAVSPDGTEIAVSYHEGNTLNGYISLIYTNNDSVKTMALPQGIASICFTDYFCQQNLAFSNNGKLLYIANIANPAGMLAVLDISSGIFSNITLSYSIYGAQFANSADGISVSPGGKFAYVMERQGLVLKINTSNNNVIGHVYINGGPLSISGAQTTIDDIVFSPNGAYAYVMSQGASNNGSIAVVNTSNDAVINNMEVAQNPGHMSISGNGKIGYLIYTPFSLSAPSSDYISVINLSTMTLLKTITLNEAPTSSAIYNNILYVTANTPTGISSLYNINATSYSLINVNKIDSGTFVDSVLIANSTI